MATVACSMADVFGVGEFTRSTVARAPALFMYTQPKPIAVHANRNATAASRPQKSIHINTRGVSPSGHTTSDRRPVVATQAPGFLAMLRAWCRRYHTRTMCHGHE